MAADRERFEQSPFEGRAMSRVQNGERILVTEGGRDAVALVSIRDLTFLEALEDAEDMAATMANKAADDASRESPVTLQQARERLGL
jgi:antitoxin (DNA-binding transcriptional repressor) of toxin-antitoxin stability system